MPPVKNITHFNECGHNQKKERICQYVERGGGGAGGCAFDGAQIVLVPITDAAHLVHGPIACAGNSWNTRGSLSGGSLMYRNCFTTDLTENDIVYGAEEKLKAAIEYISANFAPSVIFVYSTCITSLIGEDIGAVCKRAAANSAIPVIPVVSPGYAGSKNFGNRLAGEVLLEHVIGTVEPEGVSRYEINMIGEYNIAGELWTVKPLLEKLGISVRAVMTGDAAYRDIASCHRVHLNVMVCSRALINIAQAMEDEYGIPYIEESFFGISNTGNALRNIAGHFDDAELVKKAEVLIKDEEKLLKARLVPYKKVLEGKKVVLYTGGVKSWSIISALSDLGMQVVACGTRKSTPDDIEKMKNLLGENALLLKDTSPEVLLKLVREMNADIMIAGGRNQYTALKAVVPYLDVNQDREHPYTGYDGTLNFAKMLAATCASPVWERVRRKPPWE